MSVSSISYIAYASGLHGAGEGSSKGPSAFASHLSVEDLWHAYIEPNQAHNHSITSAIELNESLSLATELCTMMQQPFVVIGGDHTCALGTWSGVSNALEQTAIGMIWIDAHLDAHTPETTPSGNVHGMPMAALLGHGDVGMTGLRHTQPKIDHQRLVYIGTRSFETEERALLDHLGATIYDMPTIEDKGLATCIHEALNLIGAEHKPFGISLDLDVFDPQYAPGVSCREPNGLSPQALLDAWPKDAPKPVGLEIVELNPDRDHNHQTTALVQPIIDCLLT